MGAACSSFLMLFAALPHPSTSNTKPISRLPLVDRANPSTKLERLVVTQWLMFLQEKVKPNKNSAYARIKETGFLVELRNTVGRHLIVSGLACSLRSCQGL